MKSVKWIVLLCVGMYNAVDAMKRQLSKPQIVYVLDVEDVQDGVEDSGCSCCSKKKGVSLYARQGGRPVLRAPLTEHQKQLVAREMRRLDTHELFMAVLNNNVKAVLYWLLSEYTDVNAKTGIGWAPLHYAVRDRNVPVARILLAAKGIDTKSVNGSGHIVREVVMQRRDCATEEHQALCDQILELLDAYESSQYPFAIKGNKLIQIATGQVIETTI